MTLGTIIIILSIVFYFILLSKAIYKNNSEFSKLFFILSILIFISTMLAFLIIYIQDNWNTIIF